MKAFLALRSVGFCVRQKANVPECAVGFLFCLDAAKIPLSFSRLFLSFYNER